jgi:hypothetical protein
MHFPRLDDPAFHRRDHLIPPGMGPRTRPRHHAYELAFTAIELRSWHRAATKLFADLAPQ